jgi:hypothetical protein
MMSCIEYNSYYSSQTRSDRPTGPGAESDSPAGDESPVPDSNSGDEVMSLAQDVIELVLSGGQPASSPRCPAAQYRTLCLLVHQTTTTHSTLLDDMLATLRVTDADSAVEACRGVVESLFSDGECNWGRVIIVLTFAGWLGRHCVTVSDRRCDARQLTTRLAAQLGSSPLAAWVAQHNQQTHWVSVSVGKLVLAKQFPAHRLEPNDRGSILGTFVD